MRKTTGILIADYFKDKDYEAVPAVLCKNHGRFYLGVRMLMRQYTMQ